MEAERLRCAFSLLRYVPDPVRNEFVNVGVLLHGPDGSVHLRMTRDWRRLRCLDPDADVAGLEALESEMRRRLAEESDGKLMRLIEESFSNNLQLTAPKAREAESAQAAVDDLMRMYVERPPRERASRLSGRAAIGERMRGEFERAGVWDLLRKRIAAAEYTRPGDPLRIDVGYRPNGVIRMFQAVSLRGGAGSAAGAGGAGLEMAKVLAFSESGLRAGVRRVEGAELELTAVVEPVWSGEGRGPEGAEAATGEGAEAKGRGRRSSRGAAVENEDVAGMSSEALEAYRFAVETMEEHRIRVLTTADLRRVAETARQELRV